jgi:hypothetical protein
VGVGAEKSTAASGAKRIVELEKAVTLSDIYG